MTTAYTTRGRTVSFKQQTSLTDAPTTSFDEIRLEEPVTIPTDEKMVVAQPNLGHAFPYNWEDQPVTYEGVRADAITLPLTFRQGSAAGVNSPISEFAESAGCGLTVTSDDTIATYTDEANFTLTSGLGSDDLGVCLAVELDSGSYYPTLVNNYTQSGTAVVLQMDLPSAASTSNNVQACETIFPKVGQVTASKLQSLRVNTLGAHTTSNDLAWYLRGCALSSFGEIVIEPGAAEAGITKISPTFHAASVDQTNVLMEVESFRDHSKVQHIANNLVFEFADFAAGGEITHANLELLKATITLNHQTVPIPGEGSTSTLSGIQGYMAQMPEQPQVVLEVLMDKAYWDDFDNDQTEKHIGFVMPSSAVTSVAWGIWLPKCYQIASPVAELHGSEYIKATLTYAATSPEFGTESFVNGSGDAPWFMALMQQ